MTSGNFADFLNKIQVEYLTIRQNGLDLFSCDASGNRYLFALEDGLERDNRADGSVELRERDYERLEKILSPSVVATIKSGEARVAPYTEPRHLDNLTLSAFEAVAKGGAARIKNAELQEIE